MAKLFGRRARLLIAVPSGTGLNSFGPSVIEITDMRVTFKTKKTLGKEPNTAEVTVYNLSEQTRAELQDKNLRVTLQAGYADTLATIFIGDSRDIDSETDGPTWQTAIELGDGERAYKHARTSRSFRGGVKVNDILRRIADDLGLGGSINGAESLRSKQFVSGYVAHGKSAKELDRLLRGFGFEWSIQDGDLQILKPDEPTSESIISLDSSSGLIGSPTLNTPEGGVVTSVDPFKARVTSTRVKGKPTLKARSLLQPEIKCGRKIDVDSITGIRGRFKITSVEHSGDTSGGDWYSDFEGTPL